MTWLACGVEALGEEEAASGTAATNVGAAPCLAQAHDPGGLTIHQGRDGSFSLWSEAFGEGFHSGRGALREARETFLAPSQLERFRPGQRLTVVEVGVGTGTNTAVLLEACDKAGLPLEWWGLEVDPAPLKLALHQPAFRQPWPKAVLEVLDDLGRSGGWRGDSGSGRILWGDARQTLPRLLLQRLGQVDLVWQDAFSPRHCPQLWTVEFLGALATLLTAQGRWISYCSAAAVRETLAQQGLQLAALAVPAGPDEGKAPQGWSGGSLASPAPWPSRGCSWRPWPCQRARVRAECARGGAVAAWPAPRPGPAAPCGALSRRWKRSTWVVPPVSPTATPPEWHQQRQSWLSGMRPRQRP